MRYRFREFSIQADHEPDAEPITYAMRCCVCGAESEPSISAQRAADWIPTHLRREPEHLAYREIITRPYKAVPGAWR